MAGQATIADERRHFGAREAGEATVPADPRPAAATQPTTMARRPSASSPGRVLAAAFEAEAARGTSFLFLPVFMGMGVLAYLGANGEPGWTPIVLTLALAVAITRVVRGRPVLRGLALAAVMAALGAGAAKLETERAGTRMTGSAVTTRITGIVARIEQQASGRVRLTIDVTRTQRPELRHAPQRVRLTARAVPVGLAPGETVIGAARLMPPSGPVRPGGYDFAFASHFDRIGASGFFMGDPQRVDAAPAPGLAVRVGHAVEAVRIGLAERVRRQVGGAEGEIAATLIAGMRAGIPEDAAEALRRTGLAHILAISGLHMALVAVTVMGSLRFGFALFPAWSARHPVRKYAAAAALLACAFYLAVSGMAVAAQRSFVMLGVMLLALLFDRAALTMRNLAIAALVVLAVSPHEVVGPSFQMSFAATAVLIGAYTAWNERRAKRPHGRAPGSFGLASRLWRAALLFTGGLAATSILAGLATTLYGVHHFHRVSPYALQANMLAMPIVSLLVMPAAVMSVLAMPLGLEAPFLAAMGRGLAAVNAIAAWFSERSPVDAVGAIPASSFVLMTAALVLAALLTTWLRLAAVPLALAGLALLATRDLPDVLVSEDARLVALRLDDGTLAVNRARPNGFTIQNWVFAQAAPGWRGPDSGTSPVSAPGGAPAGFACAEGVCIGRASADGPMIVHAADAASAAPHCAQAALIVIADATRRPACAGHGVAIVTARDLALRGSAAIHFGDIRSDPGEPAANALGPDAGGRGPATNGADRPEGRPRVVFAIADPHRPWHEHRRFSREARGLPPIERRQRDTQ